MSNEEKMRHDDDNGDECNGMTYLVDLRSWPPQSLPYPSDDGATLNELMTLFVASYNIFRVEQQRVKLTTCTSSSDKHFENICEGNSIGREINTRSICFAYLAPKLIERGAILNEVNKNEKNI